MTIPDCPAPEVVPSSIPFEDSNVRVAVRARPLLEKEILDKCQECVSYSADGREIVLGKDRRFTFDHVFGPASAQEEVYNVCVKPLVESSVAGYNATVIAYGQTGSGKTHTMGSATNATSVEEELGILPRAIRQLYESIEEQKGKTEFDVKCCFVEIYNEEIKDLLHPETPSKTISIREDGNGDIILAGVKDEAVCTYDDMMRCLEQGSAFRTTGSTLMNQLSSRSHAIFTMSIEQHSLETLNGHEIISAKFHLVDLAGSERAKRTGAVGMRFKESVTINCGLLALGNVISALGDERKRGQHVPYRESKLTRILQDSLGGNSKTCMIACISTADINFEETLNTLKYANRARNIQNKPIINRDAHSVQLNQLRCEVKLLQELLKARTQVPGEDMPQALTIPTAELQMLRQKSLNVEQEFLQLKQECETSKQLLKNLEAETLTLQAESSHYQLKLEEVCTEMNSLSKIIPQWENSKEITAAPRACLLAMMKRILAALGKGDDILEPEAVPDEKPTVLKLDVATETEEQDAQDLSPKQISKGAALHLINQHVQTIRRLEGQLLEREEQLLERDDEVKAKIEELLEAKDDLARDEHIFTEKVKELQFLKKVARELKKEKEDLLQKSASDAATIARLSDEAMEKENQIAELRALHASLQEEQIVNPREDIKIVDKKPVDEMQNDTATSNDVDDGSDERNKGAGPLSKDIEQQISELHSEIKKKEDELRSVKRELDTLDRAAATGRNGKKLVHEELEQQLKRLATSIKALKKQRWQLESQHLEQQKARADEKVQHLQHQVTKMRAQQDSLKRKIRDTTEKFDDRTDNVIRRQLSDDQAKKLEEAARLLPQVATEQMECFPDDKNKLQKAGGGENLLMNLDELFGRLKQNELLQQHGNTEDDNTHEDLTDESLKSKLQRVISSWYAEQQAVEQIQRQAWEARVNQLEQIERDHRALKEELENTKSLMHKAGLGIRLSSRSVRELSDGDVDLRTSVSLPPSRGSPMP